MWRHVGSFLDDYKWILLVLRIISVVMAVLSWYYGFDAGTRYLFSKGDYKVYRDIYLTRVDKVPPNVCCQEFSGLGQSDADAINYPRSKLLFMQFIIGALASCATAIGFFSCSPRIKLLAPFVSMILTLCVTQFNVMELAVNYGQMCIQCSGLKLLPWNPYFYPYMGLLGCVFFFLCGLTYKVLAPFKKQFFWKIMLLAGICIVTLIYWALMLVVIAWNAAYLVRTSLLYEGIEAIKGCHSKYVYDKENPSSEEQPNEAQFSELMEDNYSNIEPQQLDSVMPKQPILSDEEKAKLNKL